MSTVRTWADGFGRWYAEVPDTPHAAHVARAAIKAELSARDELGSAPLYLERAPEYGPNVWRETDQ